MKVTSGNGLQKVVGEEQADAAAFKRDHDKIENAKRDPWRYILYVLLLGTLPGLRPVVGVVFMVYGRERRTSYDREYEQEPPTDTAPALVPTLLRQGGEAGSYQFHRDPVRSGSPRRLRRETRNHRALDLGRDAPRKRRRPGDKSGNA